MARQYPSKRATGARYEETAVDFLRQMGYEILERNYRDRLGEIDIVAEEGGYLVFVEVKFRKTQRAGHALAAVDYRKQCRICRTADYYRYLHKLGDNVSVRYDVVGIQGEEIQWVQNAFPHVYR